MIAYHDGFFKNQDQINIGISNRAFRYGDGVFETILVKNSKPQYLEHHFDRLAQSCNLLKMDIKINLEDLTNIIVKLSNFNKSPTCGARISIYRNSPSLGYLPIDITKASIIIELFNLPQKPLNTKIGVSSYTRQFSSSLPVFSKTANSLQFVMTKIEASLGEFFDCIMLNEKGFVCEFSSGNIFWYKNNQIYTPSLRNGLVDGIARKIFIQNNPNTTEGSFRIEDVKSASRILFTNSILGLIDVHF